MIAIILNACGDKKPKKEISSIAVVSDDCDSKLCQNGGSPTLYRRALYACGFDLGHGEPLPTISPLLINENMYRGFLLSGALKVIRVPEDPFRAYSPQLDCKNFSLEKISLVEVFEIGPNSELSKSFPEDKINNLEWVGSEQLSPSCTIDAYKKPFSKDLGLQLFVLARHKEFSQSEGIKCSAAAHFILADFDISDGVENHIELRGPLKNRFRFVIDDDVRKDD